MLKHVEHLKKNKNIKILLSIRISWEQKHTRTLSREFFFFQQHLVTMFPASSKFPDGSSIPIILTKKIKGIPRTRHGEVTISDFTDVTVHNRASRTLTAMSLRKFNFRIYLIQTKKKMLSRFSVKRLYCDQYRTRTSHYSFPLNWRGRIIK